MTIEGESWIGASVERLEDPPLVTGHGRYAGDMAFPHQLHMRVVRSPVAHGAIDAIDATAALAAPGVHAVWTFADVAHIPPIGFRLTGLTALEPYRQYALARDTVRYVGEPVAVVFAADQYAAEDAADLVVLDITSLPVILDATAAPGAFDAERNTEPAIIEKKSGDIDAAFRAAHSIIELDLKVGRHSGVPLETRGALARYDSSRDVLELYGAAKVPHRNRDSLVRMFARSAAAQTSTSSGYISPRTPKPPPTWPSCNCTLSVARPNISARRSRFQCGTLAAPCISSTSLASS